MNSKWITIILLIAILSGIVAGECDSFHVKKAAEKQREKVIITFWDDNAGSKRTPIWKELIDRFEEIYPYIDIEYVGLHKDSAKSKLDAAIASNTTPDVASIYTSWIPEFVEHGALLELDHYYNRWEGSHQIDPIAIDYNRRFVEDKKLYGIPYTMNLDVLWIRTDWFENKNVSPPNTWDEFFRGIKQLTQLPEKGYGFSIRGGAGGSFQLQRMMFAYSGISEYFINGKSTINDPKHVEFLTKYFSLYNIYTPKSDIANDYRAMIGAFDSGAVAMIQHNLGSFGEHQEWLSQRQFQAIPLPKSNSSDQYIIEGGNTIGLSAFQNTKHAEEAWEFIRFINTRESQSYWNEQAGQLPTNKDSLQEEWIQKSAHMQMALQIYKDPETKVYIPPFYLPEYRSILNTTVDPGIQEVLSGKKDIELFLDEWAEEMEKAYQRYIQ